jgi:hypothetical protein
LRNDGLSGFVSRIARLLLWWNMADPWGRHGCSDDGVQVTPTLPHQSRP